MICQTRGEAAGLRGGAAIRANESRPLGVSECVQCIKAEDPYQAGFFRSAERKGSKGGGYDITGFHFKTDRCMFRIRGTGWCRW